MSGLDASRSPVALGEQRSEATSHEWHWPSVNSVYLLFNASNQQMHAKQLPFCQVVELLSNGSLHH